MANLLKSIRNFLMGEEEDDDKKNETHAIGTAQAKQTAHANQAAANSSRSASTPTTKTEAKSDTSALGNTPLVKGANRKGTQAFTATRTPERGVSAKNIEPSAFGDAKKNVGNTPLYNAYKANYGADIEGQTDFNGLQSNLQGTGVINQNAINSKYMDSTVKSTINAHNFKSGNQALKNLGIAAKEQQPLIGATTKGGNSYKNAVKQANFNTKFNEGWNSVTGAPESYTYLSDENTGKAPKGMQVGDTVETDGGSYTITGVFSDGSYRTDAQDNAQRMAEQARNQYLGYLTTEDILGMTPEQRAKTLKEANDRYTAAYCNTLYGEGNWYIDETGHTVIKPGVQQRSINPTNKAVRDENIQLEQGKDYKTSAVPLSERDTVGDGLLSKLSAGVSNVTSDDSKAEQYARDQKNIISSYEAEAKKKMKEDPSLGNTDKGGVSEYKNSEKTGELNDYWIYVGHMTEDQKKTYNTIYATDGWKAAKEYYEALKFDSLEGKQYEGEVKMVANEVENATGAENIVLSAYSTLTNTVGGSLAGAANLGREIGNATGLRTYRPITGKTSFDALSEEGSLVRSAVSEKIDNPALRIAYEGAMGLADMMAYAAMLSPASAIAEGVAGSSTLAKLGASAFGEDGKLTNAALKAIKDAGISAKQKAAAKGLYAAFYTSSAQQAILSTLQSGGSQQQALLNGLLQGAEEVLAEKLPTEMFTRALYGMAGTGVKGIAKNALLNMTGEALEEGVTQIAQSLTDTVILGDRSQWSQLVQNYMDEGYSEADAIKKANSDTYVMGTLRAMAIGGISGMGMGAGATTLGTFSADADLKKDSTYAKIIALEVKKSDYTSAKAKATADKVLGFSNDKIKMWELADMKSDLQEASDKQAKEDIDSILTTFGVTGKDRLVMSLAAKSGKEGAGYQTNAFVNAAKNKTKEMTAVINKDTLTDEENEALQEFAEAADIILASDISTEDVKQALSDFMTAYNEMYRGAEVQPLGTNVVADVADLVDTAEESAEETVQTMATEEPMVVEEPMVATAGASDTKASVKAKYHKSSESSKASKNIKRAKGKAKLTDADYDVVEEKNGVVSFIKVDDFDGNTEPNLISKTNVNLKTGVVTHDDVSGQIIPDKSTLVSDDYTGFDVAAQRERENAWKSEGYSEAYNRAVFEQEYLPKIEKAKMAKPAEVEEPIVEEAEETTEEESVEEPIVEEAEEAEETEEPKTEEEAVEESEEETEEDFSEKSEKYIHNEGLLSDEEVRTIEKTMGRKGARLYNKKENAMLHREIATMYNLGRRAVQTDDDINFSELYKSMRSEISRLSKSKAEAAFEAGMHDAGSMLNNSAHIASGVSKNSDGYKSVSRRISSKTMEELDTLAKVLGVRIEFVNELNSSVGTDLTQKVLKEGKEFYKYNAIANTMGRTIQIRAKDAADPVFFSALHESVHFLRANDPKAYNELKSYIEDKMFDGDFARAVGVKADIYNLAKDDDLAEEETLANIMAGVLSNEDLTLDFAATKKNVFEKILDYLTALLDKILGRKRLSDSGIHSLTEEEKVAIDMLQSDIASIKRMYEYALEDSYNNRSEEGGFNGEAEEFYGLSELFDSFGFETKVIESEAETTTLLIRQNKSDEFVPLSQFSTEITREMLEKTQFGALTDLTEFPSEYEKGSDKWKTDQEEQRQNQYDGAIGLCNLIFTTQDPELVWRVAGTTMRSAITTNADTQYNKTIDLGTICKKTQDVLNIMCAAMVEKGRALTDVEIYGAYKKALDETGLAPCAQCYVFSHWFKVGSYFETMYICNSKYKDWSAEEAIEVSKFVNETIGFEGKSTDRDKRFAKALVNKSFNGVKFTDKQMDYILDRKWFDKAFVQFTKDKDTGEVTYPEAKDIDKSKIFIADDAKTREYCFDVLKTPDLAREYPNQWAYRNGKGSAAGKAIIPFTSARFGEVLQGLARDIKNIKIGEENPVGKDAEGAFNSTEELRKLIETAIAKTRWQNLAGGIRLHSSSDFRFDAALDYFMILNELAAAKVHGQGYTKAPEELDWFCRAGIDTCISLIGKGTGLTADGELEWSSVQGVALEIARHYRNMYDNAQTIAIGMSDEHIEKLLDADFIDQIIPWHRSANSGVRMDMMFAFSDKIDEFAKNCQDYTDVQEDKELPVDKLIAYYKAIGIKGSEEEIKARAEKAVALREFRARLIGGKLLKPTEEDKAIIDSLAEDDSYTGIILRDLYQRFYVLTEDEAYHAWAGKSDEIALHMPYEFFPKGFVKRNGKWYPTTVAAKESKNYRKSTPADAPIIRDMFIEYMHDIGCIPRFSGFKYTKKGVMSKVKFGDFTKHDNYYKVLIDRRMFDREGKYRDQDFVNSSKFDPSYTYDEIYDKTTGEKKQGIPKESRRILEENDYKLRQSVGLSKEESIASARAIDTDETVVGIIEGKIASLRGQKKAAANKIIEEMEGSPITDVYRRLIDEGIIKAKEDDIVKFYKNELKKQSANGEEFMSAMGTTGTDTSITETFDSAKTSSGKEKMSFTPNQIRSTLTELGVTEGDMKIMGVEDFLKGKKSISKKQVLDYFRPFEELDEALAEQVAESKAVRPNERFTTPTKTNDAPNRKNADTVANSGILAPEAIPKHLEAIRDGNFTYAPSSNLSAIQSANKTIEEKGGLDGALEHWKSLMDGHAIPTPETIALGERLIQELSAKEGYSDKVSDLVGQFAKVATDLGKSLQAVSIMNRLGGPAKAAYLRKVIEDINYDNTHNKDFIRATDKGMKKEQKAIEDEIAKLMDEYDIEGKIDRAELMRQIKSLLDEMLLGIESVKSEQDALDDATAERDKAKKDKKKLTDDIYDAVDNQQDLDDMMCERAETYDEILDLNDLIEEEDLRLEVAKAELEALKEERRKLKARLDALKKSADKKEDAIPQMEDELHALDLQIEASEKSVDSLKAEADELNEKLKEAKRKLKSNLKRIEKLIVNNAAVRERVRNLSDLEEKLHMSEEKVKEAKVRKQTVESLYKALQRKHKAMADRLKKYDDAYLSSVDEFIYELNLASIFQDVAPEDNLSPDKRTPGVRVSMTDKIREMLNEARLMLKAEDLDAFDEEAKKIITDFSEMENNLNESAKTAEEIRKAKNELLKLKRQVERKVIQASRGLAVQRQDMQEFFEVLSESGLVTVEVAEKPELTTRQKAEEIYSKLKAEHPEINMEVFDFYKDSLMDAIDTAESRIARLESQKATEREIAAEIRKLVRSANSSAMNNAKSVEKQRTKLEEMVRTFRDEAVDQDTEEEQVDLKAQADELLAKLKEQNNSYDAVDFASYQKALHESLDNATRLKEKFDAEREGIREAQKRINHLKKRFAELGGVQVPEDLLMKLARARTPEDIKKYEDAIVLEVASQLKPSIIRKLNAWRYLAMLGNPRTHVRNALSNAAMAAVRDIKDFNAGAAEGLVSHLSGGKLDRTKSVKAHTPGMISAYADVLKQDAEDMKIALRGKGKYDTLGDIRDKMRFFKNEAIQRAYKFNMDALEVEDWIFLAKHYKTAMRGYLVANNITPEQFASPTEEQAELIQKGREYAVLEAQKATFRDDSAVADALTRLANSNEAMYVAVESVVPFKKTPINILKRGLEYSPLGYVHAIKKGISLAKYGEYGEVTGADVIDSIAAGTTGTGILILGAVLAYIGLLRGEDDDAYKTKLEKMLGLQDYSLHIGDYTFSLDWAAPTTIPLFIGAKIADLLEADEDIDNKDIISAVANAFAGLSAPMYEMSVLSGIHNFLEEIQYTGGYSSDEKMNALVAAGEQLVYGYLSEYVPTLFGQIARVVDPVSRGTYTDPNSSLSSTTQYNLQKVLNKFSPVRPKLEAIRDFAGEHDLDTLESVADFFYRNTGTEYQDTWGNNRDTGNVLWRMLSNFILPGTVNKYTYDAVNEELLRLYGNSDEAADLASKLPKKTSNGSGEDKVEFLLDRDQYERANRQYGNGYYTAVNNLMNMPSYAGLSDEVKISAIKSLQTYYQEAAFHSTFPAYETKKAYNTLEENKSSGIPILESVVYAASLGESSMSAEAINAVKETGIDLSTYAEMAGAVTGRGYTSSVAKGMAAVEQVKAKGLDEDQSKAFLSSYGSKQEVYEGLIEAGVTPEAYDSVYTTAVSGKGYNTDSGKAVALLREASTKGWNDAQIAALLDTTTSSMTNATNIANKQKAYRTLAASEVDPKLLDTIAAEIKARDATKKAEKQAVINEYAPPGMSYTLEVIFGLHNTSGGGGGSSKSGSSGGGSGRTKSRTTPSNRTGRASRAR